MQNRNNYLREQIATLLVKFDEYRALSNKEIGRKALINCDAELTAVIKAISQPGVDSDLAGFKADLQAFSDSIKEWLKDSNIPNDPQLQQFNKPSI